MVVHFKKDNVFFPQLKKQFPAMNLKIPAKRIFGDNFDPGILQFLDFSCILQGKFCHLVHIR